MSPIWTFRTTMGLFTHGRFLPLVAAGINIVVSIILAKHIGLIGVLLGTTFSRFFAGIWTAPYIVYHYGFHKRSGRYYFRWFINLFVVCLDIGLVFLFSKYVVLNGVAAIVVYGLLSVLIFITSTTMIYFRTPEFKYALRIIGKYARSFHV